MTKIKNIKERELISLITGILEKNQTHTSQISDKYVGPGMDDCAVIDIDSSKLLVASTDMLHSTTDFPPGMTPQQMGWMSVAVNLSDIAAMGASPIGIMMALGLPPDLELDFVEALVRGMDKCAGHSGTVIIGGDIDRHDEITISGSALGPGDTIDFTYSINIDQDAKDGIHFLNFVFVGGGDMYDVRWKVPVTVDSSQVEIISTESLDGSHYVVLDIANTRPNTINAVTIIPVTENVTFEPAQYFIGTMDSDEMFTIRFDVDTDDDIDRIRIKASFKNGNNWHESAIQTFGMNNSKHETAIESESNPLIIIGIVGGILVVLVVFFVIMRRRRRSNEES
jgi:hypothetical protein